jgi:hypothetical protein
MTLSRKLGEAVVEVVSDISKAAAEQPQRWQEFQVSPQSVDFTLVAAGAGTLHHAMMITQ